MSEYVMRMIEMNENDDEKDWLKRMKAMLFLRGLCEDFGFISFILSFLSFSLLFLFSFFSQMIWRY
jgi:hypothetical protein